MGHGSLTLTLGLPARLVTSRMSFTVPCSLHRSSSSSFVQEKGKPEIKSLCFSRAVLYRNICQKPRGVKEMTTGYVSPTPPPSGLHKDAPAHR